MCNASYGPFRDLQQRRSKFAGSSTNAGYYTLYSNYSGSKWLYDNGGQASPVVDRNGSYEANKCDWTIEEVTWLPVKINETYRYGTFTSPLNLTQDNSRLKFYTGKMNNGYLELTQYTQAIPAGTPFMIEYIEGGQVSQGSSFLQVAGSAPVFSGSTDLVGTLEPIAKPTNQGTIYTLQPAWDKDAADHNSASEVAFRQFNGSDIRGFSAYLPVAAGTQVAGMRFITDEVTVIEGINADQQHKVEAYDLSGRRVQQAKKGLYIINGKKVIIR